MTFMRGFIILAVLTSVTAVAVSFIARSDPFPVLAQEGHRIYALDAATLEINTEEETGTRYFDFSIRISYTTTTNVDYVRYFMKAGSREWQPVTAKGCDAEGNVLEL